MLLQPKRTKFRRVHRGRRKGEAQRGTTVAFGEYGLVATENAWVTGNQIESARRVVTRYTRRGGKYWIRVFPDKSVTKKPAETRMGSGKGAPDHWVAVVLRGRMLLEIGGVREDQAKQALTIAGHKFPMGTKIVTREFAAGEEMVLGRKAEMRAQMAVGRHALCRMRWSRGRRSRATRRMPPTCQPLRKVRITAPMRTRARVNNDASR